MLCIQLFNGLIHCPTGQKEAIDVLIRAMVKQSLREAGGIRGKIALLFALLKNDTFRFAISPGGDHTQNVHIISHYHSRLRNVLGLSSGLGDFRERVGRLGRDPHGSDGNALKAFYQFFTTDCLVDSLLAHTQTRQDFSVQEEERAVGEQIRREKADGRKAALRTQLATLKAKWTRVKIERPITPLEIHGDLMVRGLLTEEEDWKKYFSSDPAASGEFFELTRKGAQKYLVGAGVLIDASTAAA
jgi:hypothetical protein